MASSSRSDRTSAKKAVRPAKANQSTSDGQIELLQDARTSSKKFSTAKSSKKSGIASAKKAVSTNGKKFSSAPSKITKSAVKKSISPKKTAKKADQSSSKKSSDSASSLSTSATSQPEKTDQKDKDTLSARSSSKSVSSKSTKQSKDTPSQIFTSTRSGKYTVPVPRIRSRKVSWFRRVAIFITIFSVIIFAVGFYAWRQLDTFAGDVFVGSDTGDILSVLTTGFASDPQPIPGQAEGRTNVLLVGQDSAAGLTDTLMIASYYHETGEIATVNIPRDFWVRPRSLWGMKINAVHPFAESQFGAGEGGAVLSEFIAGELGIPIHYWVMVNFDGLKSAIDELGGVEIEVEQYLIDCQYPTNNYSGFIRPCPEFQPGVQQMDGRTALIYSRSRKTTSDFDRSRRQSKVVEAMLSKARSQVTSGELVLSPNRVAAFLDIFGRNVQTSIPISDIPSLYATFKDVEIEGKFHRYVWQNGNGFLCSALDTRGSVVVYCDGTEPSGTDRTGVSKRRARESIANLLQFALDQEALIAQQSQ